MLHTTDCSTEKANDDREKEIAMLKELIRLEKEENIKKQERLASLEEKFETQKETISKLTLENKRLHSKDKWGKQDPSTSLRVKCPFVAVESKLLRKYMKVDLWIPSLVVTC